MSRGREANAENRPGYIALDAPMVEISWQPPILQLRARTLTLSGASEIKDLDQDGHVLSTRQQIPARIMVTFNTEKDAHRAYDSIMDGSLLKACVILFAGKFEDFYLTTKDGRTIRTPGLQK